MQLVLALLAATKERIEWQGLRNDVHTRGNGF
jgi:hypothetical protein